MLNDVKSGADEWDYYLEMQKQGRAQRFIEKHGLQNAFDSIENENHKKHLMLYIDKIAEENWSHKKLEKDFLPSIRSKIEMLNSSTGNHKPQMVTGTQLASPKP
jgi:hypothetical protein